MVLARARFLAGAVPGRGPGLLAGRWWDSRFGIPRFQFDRELGQAMLRAAQVDPEGRDRDAEFGGHLQPVHVEDDNHAIYIALSSGQPRDEIVEFLVSSSSAASYGQVERDRGFPWEG
jgi:hypothetical protein